MDIRKWLKALPAPSTTGQSSEFTGSAHSHSEPPIRAKATAPGYYNLK
uniref:Uncharacterized protein n=1 Tax=Anguilla anguilla TaxID=7936 RepID=A0A0E9PYL9_ANGAN